MPKRVSTQVQRRFSPRASPDNVSRISGRSWIFPINRDTSVEAESIDHRQESFGEEGTVLSRRDVRTKVLRSRPPSDRESRRDAGGLCSTDKIVNGRVVDPSLRDGRRGRRRREDEIVEMRVRREIDVLGSQVRPSTKKDRAIVW